MILNQTVDVLFHDMTYQGKVVHVGENKSTIQLPVAESKRLLKHCKSLRCIPPSITKTKYSFPNKDISGSIIAEFPNNLKDFFITTQIETTKEYLKELPITTEAFKNNVKKYTIDPFPKARALKALGVLQNAKKLIGPTFNETMYTHILIHAIALTIERWVRSFYRRFDSLLVQIESNGEYEISYWDSKTIETYLNTLPPFKLYDDGNALRIQINDVSITIKHLGKVLEELPEEEYEDLEYRAKQAVTYPIRGIKLSRICSILTIIESKPSIL